jgi:hypothetical protein
MVLRLLSLFLVARPQQAKQLHYIPHDLNSAGRWSREARNEGKRDVAIASPSLMSRIAWMLSMDIAGLKVRCVFGKQECGDVGTCWEHTTELVSACTCSTSSIERLNHETFTLKNPDDLNNFAISLSANIRRACKTIAWTLATKYGGKS